MTTATVAQPTGTNFAVLLVMFLLISFITCVVLWVHERRWDAHEERLTAHAEQLATLGYQMPALLEFLGIEILEPVADDSPGALADADTDPWGIEQDKEDVKYVTWVPAPPDEWPGVYDDADTEEIPVSPATEPSSIPIQVHGALIERPSPVPRGLADEMPHPVDSAERRAKTAADIDERLKQFNFTGGRR